MNEYDDFWDNGPGSCAAKKRSMKYTQEYYKDCNKRAAEELKMQEEQQKLLETKLELYEKALEEMASPKFHWKHGRSLDYGRQSYAAQVLLDVKLMENGEDV
jgi:hypothetical protein